MNVLGLPNDSAWYDNLQCSAECIRASVFRKHWTINHAQIKKYIFSIIIFYTCRRFKERCWRRWHNWNDWYFMCGPCLVWYPTRISPVNRLDKPLVIERIILALLFNTIWRVRWICIHGWNQMWWLQVGATYAEVYVFNICWIIQN